jgi:hypothetical protein
MSELRHYLQEYIDTLQALLKQYDNDDLLVGKAQELFRDANDPRYLVLAQRLAQIKKKKQEAVAQQNQNDKPAFKLVDKHKY